MKKKNPLVSVIINCFNGDRYLNYCIRSVLNQTYKNWEIIFWDNVSVDRSKEIFKSFKDKRLKYFLATKHTNLYKARNLALKKAKGQIITFLDVDDSWLENKLLLQVKYLNENKSIDFVYSNLFRLKNFFFFNIKSKIFKDNLPSGFILNKILKLYTVGWPTVAIRKKVFKNKKKPFNENIDMLSDYIFVLNFSAKNKIGAIQDTLAVYREHNKQLSRKLFTRQATQFTEWFKKIKKTKEFNKQKNFSCLLDKFEMFDIILKLKKETNILKKIKLINKIGNFNIKTKAYLFLFLDRFFINYLLSTS